MIQLTVTDNHLPMILPIEQPMLGGVSMDYENENIQEKQFNRFFIKLIAGGVTLHLLLAGFVALQIG